MESRVVDHVIKWIESGDHRFWAVASGKSVWIEVQEHPMTKRKFLTKQGDGYPPNNLLNLQDCP